MPQRPQREAYVRAVLTTDTLELVTGVELRPEDDVPSLRSTTRDLMASTTLLAYLGERAVAERIEALLRLRYPDRAYFIEVATNSDEGWVQIFQPWDRTVFGNEPAGLPTL